MPEQRLVKISDDALARALGADKLAAAFEKKGCEVHRTSSWGMQWLEPLVEIDGIGWGPARSRTSTTSSMAGPTRSASARSTRIRSLPASSG